MPIRRVFICGSNCQKTRLGPSWRDKLHADRQAVARESARDRNGGMPREVGRPVQADQRRADRLLFPVDLNVKSADWWCGDWSSGSDDDVNAFECVLEFLFGCGLARAGAQIIYCQDLLSLFKASPDVLAIICGARWKIALRFVIVGSFRKSDVVGRRKKRIGEARHGDFMDLPAERLKNASGCFKQLADFGVDTIEEVIGGPADAKALPQIALQLAVIGARGSLWIPACDGLEHDACVFNAAGDRPRVVQA